MMCNINNKMCNINNHWYFSVEEVGPGSLFLGVLVFYNAKIFLVATQFKPRMHPQIIDTAKSLLMTLIIVVGFFPERLKKKSGMEAELERAEVFLDQPFDSSQCNQCEFLPAGGQTVEIPQFSVCFGGRNRL